MDLIRVLDILDQLNRVNTPTLVSVGELDPVTPVAAAEEIIAGAGHFAWLDAPDRFWTIITDFIHATNTPEPVPT